MIVVAEQSALLAVVGLRVEAKEEVVVKGFALLASAPNLRVGAVVAVEQ